MRLDQGIFVEEARIFPVEDLGAEQAADLVIDHVAEYGGGEQHADQRPDVHAALTDGSQRTGHEEQGVTGQEGKDHETRFGEDDEEQDAVDPQAILLNQNRQMLVEMQDDVDELREKFHGRLVD